MNRLIALLSIAILAGCQTARKSPVVTSGPVSITGYDAAGNQTVTSYAGRTGAGGGQVNDTTEAEVIKALADKLDGKAFTYASATRSAVVQPDTAIDQEIETKHKAALQDAAQALASGAGGSYAKAASLAADLGSQLIAARAAKANRPQPDSGAISTRILSSGDGHALAATVGIQTFGATLQAAKRGSYQSDSNQSDIDTTTARDFDALAKTFAELKKPLVIPPAALPAVKPADLPAVDKPADKPDAVEPIVTPPEKPVDPVPPVQVDPLPDVPDVQPADGIPAGAHFKLTPTTLTLKPDLVAVVRKVDALANVTHGATSGTIFIPASRSGNTWTIPQPLGSYKRGGMPNTWRISFAGNPPKYVTWHTSLHQTFVQDGASRFYPPTTRQ